LDSRCPRWPASFAGALMFERVDHGAFRQLVFL
jgi:hypothetical protein